MKIKFNICIFNLWSLKLLCKIIYTVSCFLTTKNVCNEKSHYFENVLKEDFKFSKCSFIHIMKKAVTNLSVKYINACIFVILA